MNRNCPSDYWNWSMCHPRRRNVTTSMVGLKTATHAKISPKMMNPRDLAGERRRRKEEEEEGRCVSSLSVCLSVLSSEDNILMPDLHIYMNIAFITRSSRLSEDCCEYYSCFCLTTTLLSSSTESWIALIDSALDCSEHGCALKYVRVK